MLFGVFSAGWRLVALVWGHPANERRKLRALGSLVWWQIYKRSVGKPVDIPVDGGLSFRCYADSQDSGRMIYFNGNPDPAEMAFIERYLRPGDRFIDVGANVGIYTLLAARIVGPEGNVVAFEPDPTASARLLENVRRNKLTCVTLKSAAVAETAGTFEFTVGADTGNRFATLAKAPGPTRKVTTVTLDAEIGDETYSMCKMDVEGAEFRALQGAAHLIDRQVPPVWQLELTNRTLTRSGSSVAEVQEWLRTRGFDLWTYDARSNELQPWIMRPRRPGSVGDALAIARAALPLVCRRLGGKTRA